MAKDLYGIANFKAQILPLIDKALKGKNIVYDKKPYLERNKKIVNCCDILIAAPKQINEVLRSGTWSTIRYAKKIGIEVFIILPNNLTFK